MFENEIDELRDLQSRMNYLLLKLGSKRVNITLRTIDAASIGRHRHEQIEVWVKLDGDES